MRPLSLARAASLGLLSMVAACGSSGSTSGAGEDAITSNTGVARSMSFEAVVYVAVGTSDADIISTAQERTHTAFGALKSMDVSVQTRFLHNVDKATFVKQDVTVVDPNDESFKPVPMVRVRYTYTDVALLPKNQKSVAEINFALLGADYDSGDRKERVLKECTDGDAHTRDYPLWDGFAPPRESCQTAIKAEQAAIDADTAKLDDKAAKVARSEERRLYLPIKAKLGAVQNTPTVKYPEYEKLYTDGITANQITLAMIYGYQDNAAASPSVDGRYPRWLRAIRTLQAAHPGFALVKNDKIEKGLLLSDLAAFTAGGVEVKGASFKDVLRWEIDEKDLPPGVTAANEAAFHVDLSNLLAKRWLTFEVPMHLTVRGVEQDFRIQFNTYYGTHNPETGPFRWAFKNADVVAYAGHAGLGSGSLDADQYGDDAFSPKNQIFFFDACVSYNHYTKRYFQKKPQNLQIIANGIEVFSFAQGLSTAQFLLGLIDGKLASYSSLLTKMEGGDDSEYTTGADPLRAVLGEENNVYDPEQTPIELTNLPAP